MTQKEKLVVALEYLMNRFTDYDSTYDKGYLENVADEIEDMIREYK